MASAWRDLPAHSEGAALATASSSLSEGSSFSLRNSRDQRIGSLIASSGRRAEQVSLIVAPRFLDSRSWRRPRVVRSHAFFRRRSQSSLIEWPLRRKQSMRVEGYDVPQQVMGLLSIGSWAITVGVDRAATETTHGAARDS